MPDKYTLQLKNFRSIREAEIDIAPLTVVYGPNGSGKSSLIYGLLTLKNFLTEPNRNLPGLFSYPGISLGGHDEVVFNHLNDETIEVSLSFSLRNWYRARFTLGVSESGGKSAIYVCEKHREGENRAEITLGIPFPYHVDQSDSANTYVTWMADFDGYEEEAFTEVSIGWDGVNLSIEDNKYDRGHEAVSKFVERTNSLMESAKSTYFVPLWRGFMVPEYDDVYEKNMLSSDAEVAAMVADARNLEYQVSRYMEQVTGRQFRARMQRGSSKFNIDAIPNSRDTPSSIVNDGFGVNQVAYMLTVALYDKAKIVLIEEPEIHLHPSMVRKLVHALTDIALNNDRRFVISTHSETFVVALLAQIAAGKIGVDDVSFIFADKEDGESKFTKQEAKSNGQIQGGLESFIAAEMEDMAVFFNVVQEEED
ncbi:MAG: AAA family ATPase [Dehalococcoidia bacterium]|nr:AAA family ATPase [Dehalococcoidia bacterium]